MVLWYDGFSFSAVRAIRGKWDAVVASRWNIAYYRERSRRAVNEFYRAVAVHVRNAVYPLIFPQVRPGAVHSLECHTFNVHMKQAERLVRDMAKKSGKPQSSSDGVGDLRWINRNLTEEEKAHHDTQEKSASELGILVFKIALQGYNVRVAWDNYSKCYQANIIPFQPENPNFGYALSARGITPQRAVSLLLYKHYALFNEQWAAHYKAPTNSMEG